MLALQLSNTSQLEESISGKDSRKSCKTVVRNLYHCPHIPSQKQHRRAAFRFLQRILILSKRAQYALPMANPGTAAISLKNDRNYDSGVTGFNNVLAPSALLYSKRMRLPHGMQMVSVLEFSCRRLALSAVYFMPVSITFL